MAFRIIAGKKLLVATAGAMVISYANGCYSSGNLVVGPCEEDPDAEGCGPAGGGGQVGGAGGSGGQGTGGEAVGGQGTGGEAVGGQGGVGGEGGAIGEGGAGGAGG